MFQFWKVVWWWWGGLFDYSVYSWPGPGAWQYKLDSKEGPSCFDLLIIDLEIFDIDHWIFDLNPWIFDLNPWVFGFLDLINEKEEIKTSRFIVCIFRSHLMDLRFMLGYFMLDALFLILWCLNLILRPLILLFGLFIFHLSSLRRIFHLFSWRIFHVGIIFKSKKSISWEF